MAFGIGRAFKKAWKGTFGKLEDAVKPYTPIIAGAALGALTGGLGFAASGLTIGSLSAGASGAVLGGAAGTLQGLSTYQQGRQQEAMINAQLAAADKIAAAQQVAPTIQSAAIPTVTAQEAATAEMNESTSKRKAFSFANTRRSGSVARRNTLG